LITDSKIPTSTDNRAGNDRRGSVERSIVQLNTLRRFSGLPDEFWSAYLAGVGNLCEARRGLILIATPKEEGTDTVNWQHLKGWDNGARGVESISRPSDATLQQALQNGLSIELTTKGDIINRPGRLLLRLDIGPNQPQVVLELIPRDPLISMEQSRELVFRLRLVSDIPALYQQGREYQQSRQDVVRIAEVLDLTGRLQADSKFPQASLTLCNELATRFACSQVSLGWLDSEGYVTLRSISHMVKFDRKMVTAQWLESAMEEALDQDTEVVWPVSDQRREITLAHESYARERSLKFIATLPIRHGGGQVGVLSCERTSEPFSEFDIWSLRLFVDHTVLRLVELKRGDLWLGAKIADTLGRTFAPIWGPQHFIAKFLGLMFTVVLIFSLLSSWPYRVEAPFLLKTDDSFTLPAPFDGFIQEVLVKEGDLVTKQKVLAVLDTHELLLEKVSTLAEISRYALEAEKARSDKGLAEMRIAHAMRTQAIASHDLTAYQIEQARVRTPIDGVVVEGDLQKLLGVPVRRGDALFQVASLERMYVTVDVDERDIHEINGGMTGEVAFIGRPDQYYPIRVERIDPVAEVRDGRNIFSVRAAFIQPESVDWWRPGMSGVVKLDAGDRQIIWILTHRTVEFLRMLLWW
jgi:multidrug efflux pump subunit AcrA (membrane-fusion protein)